MFSDCILPLRIEGSRHFVKYPENVWKGNGKKDAGQDDGQDLVQFI
jgi:hypothetical protein